MIRLCALVLAPRSSVVLVPLRCRRTVTAAPCFRHSATSSLFAQGNVSTWTLSPQSKIQPFFTAEEKKKWGRGRGNQLFPHRSMCSNVQLFHKCVVVAAKPIKLLFSPRITVARGLNEGIFFKRVVTADAEPLNCRCRRKNFFFLLSVGKRLLAAVCVPLLCHSPTHYPPWSTLGRRTLIPPYACERKEEAAVVAAAAAAACGHARIPREQVYLGCHTRGPRPAYWYD